MLICFDTRIISIHALRKEGDVIHGYCPFVDRAISIHALRKEGDLEIIF